MIESPLKYKDKKITSSQHAYEIMSHILNDKEPIDKDREHAWVINLNNANKILNIELISLGTTSATIVTPREVFCMAVRIRASKIIIVHNHPSNTNIPSYADISLTEELIQIGKLISIPIIDHIILTETGYFSFADYSLIDTLEENPIYRSMTSKRIMTKEKIHKRIQKRFYKKNKTH